MSSRIAIVCPNYHPRTCGVGDHSMRLAQELLRRGRDVKLFTRAPAQPNPAASEVQVFGATGRTSPRRAVEIGQAITNWGADEVLLQYTPQMLGASRLGSPAMPLLASMLKRRKIRTTLLAHELYTDLAARPDLLIASTAHRLQFLALLQLVDHVFVTTESRLAMAREWAKPLGLLSKLAVVPVGANATPIARSRQEGRFRVGVFSTLAYGKRFDVVLDAFEQIARLVPHAELLLLGDFGDPTNARVKALQAQIAHHPFAGQIRVPGRLPLDEVAREVATLEVFLFPMDTGANTRSGTLPLALGSGVPVVAIRGAETGSLFRADENLVFAEALTGAAFADAALRLWREPGLSERVSLGAKTTYDRHLRWDVIATTLFG